MSTKKTTAAAKKAGGKKSATTPRKPRRPLSGYNLYYRYKRNQVLAATAHLHARSNGQVEPSPQEENAVITAVLTAVPGLEGVPPHHALWKSDVESINEWRGQTIRQAMEGKLLPNEHARNRLHRKVHGMGFVEMGKVMRETWADADEYTKKVFCQLAEVGREGYKALLEEYRVKEEAERAAGRLEKGQEKGPKKRKVHSPKALASSLKVKNKVGSFACQPSKGMTKFQAITPQTTVKPRVAMPFVSPVISLLSQVAAPRPQVQASFSSGTTSPASSSTSLDSFEPISLTLAHITPQQSYERRVSSGYTSPVGTPVTSSVPSSLSSADSTKILQLLGDNAASLPPPPLFVSSAPGSILSPAAPSTSHDDVLLEEREMDPVDTQDFLDFIGKVDLALDDDDDAADGTTKRPSFIFGKPVHDIATPMPADYALNNPRARTA